MALVLFKRGSSTNSGSVGMFIKNSISFKICPNLNLNLANCEDLWVQLDQKQQ